ncbi:MAG: SLC13 family permease [Nitrospirota bacterium]|nr:SLC13 family permease [Nitrospirota bacterium]
MHIIIVSALIFFVVVLLSTRLIPLEIVVLGVPVVLSLTGVLPVEKAFSGFSEPAVIVIVSLFILSEGLSRTKVVRKIALLLVSLIRKHPRLLGPTILATVALFSMFLNDTGTTALFLPVALALLKESKLSPKRLLLPLGYVALLGGSSTLIGTSSNIVVSSYLETLGDHPFRMFDFFPIGAGALVLGLLYLILLEPWFFRKERPFLLPSAVPEERSFDVEIVLDPAFPYDGMAFNDSPLHREIGLSLREAKSSRLLSARMKAQSFLKASWEWSRAEERQRRSAQGPEEKTTSPETTDGQIPQEPNLLSAGQHLHILATLSQLEKLADVKGVCLEPVQHSLPSSGAEIERHPLHRFMESEDWMFAQAVLNPRSGMIGRKVSSLHFILPAKVDIVGLSREEGRRISSDLSELTLETSDVLLIQGPRAAVTDLSARNIFLYLDFFERETFRSDKAAMALLILGGVILSNVFGWLPLTLSAVSGAILMVLFGCLTIEEARNAIEWRVVMLLGGMFPLGWAISQTGLGHQISSLMIVNGHQMSPTLLLAFLMGMTALMVQFLSHNLVALIMAPIAIDLSRTLHLSPYPLMMGVAFSCTMAFLTPLSHPVNTLTWGPGDYRFGDYARVGAGVLLISFLWGLYEIPRRFPFVLH